MLIVNHMFLTYYHYVLHKGLENLEILLCMLLFKSAFVYHYLIQQSHFKNLWFIK
jgi:hypothetical protein